MAGAYKKQSAAASPRFASLVSELGSPLTRSEKLDRDPWLDRFEAKLDARFDEVRELLQELFVSSRVGEFAAEDREEEAAVEEEEEEEIATDEVEKEEDDQVAAAIVEEEEIEEEEKEVEGGSANTHLEQQQQMEAILGADLGPFQALISQLMSAANDQSSQAESFFNLSRERHPDALVDLLRPSHLLEIRAKESKEEKWLFLAFLQLTQQCPPGVCKNVLKRPGLQFAVEMGMIMVVDDKMLLPLPRPPPEPPPEPPHPPQICLSSLMLAFQSNSSGFLVKIVACLDVLQISHAAISMVDACAGAISGEGKTEIMVLLKGSHEVSQKAHEQLSEHAKNLEHELATLRGELLSSRYERDKMLLEANFAKERLDSFMKEFDHQRREANAVSSRNVELTHLIIDYQRRLRESSDFLQTSEEYSRKLSMEISILKHDSVPVRIAACMCIKNISRGVTQLVQLAEWITIGGMVSAETAASASEECEKMLRMGDRAGRPGYDRKKLLLYAIISGCRRQIDRLLRDLPTLFNTIEDFLWFILSAVRDCPSGTASVVLSEGLIPYSLDDLQGYLNKFEPSYYTKNGKDPLVYPYILLLSIQLLPAVQYLSKEMGEEGYNVDAVHISIALADHGVLSEGAGASHKLGAMDACTEVASIIRQYGSAYLRHGNLLLALEYYAQASAAMGGGELSWIGRASTDQQRQRSMMLKQLLTEILLREGGILLLLGPRGTGDEGELRKYLMDWKSQQQFLLETAHQCQETGFYDKSVEIHKRVGAFGMALETINKCLSDAICATARGRLDGDSRASGLVHSGSNILETFRYSSEVSLQEKELVSEQQTVLRQLEAILSVHRLARAGQHVDALREITKLSFLPLNPRGPEVATDTFRNLSSHVQACVPDLLKVALTCADNAADSDGTVRILKSKIANFVANNISRSWPHDLLERVSRSI